MIVQSQRILHLLYFFWPLLCFPPFCWCSSLTFWFLRAFLICFSFSRCHVFFEVRHSWLRLHSIWSEFPWIESWVSIARLTHWLIGGSPIQTFFSIFGMNSWLSSPPNFWQRFGRLLVCLLTVESRVALRPVTDRLPDFSMMGNTWWNIIIMFILSIYIIHYILYNNIYIIY